MWSHEEFTGRASINRTCLGPIEPGRLALGSYCKMLASRQSKQPLGLWSGQLDLVGNQNEFPDESLMVQVERVSVKIRIMSLFFFT